MNLKKYLFIILIISINFFLNGNDINIDEYSILGDNEPDSKFKIIVWDNSNDINLKCINKLSYEELRKKYNSVIIINEKNVVSYYWDEQVIKIITNKKSYRKMFDIENNFRSNEFFSVILNNKILYNGVVWKGSLTKNQAIILPSYLTNFGENINIIIINPYIDIKKTRLNEFNKKDRKKIQIKKLYNYFNLRNKIVHGDFHFNDMKLNSDGSE